MIHGTSSVYVDEILKNGLRVGTSLTRDEGIADYFGAEAVDDAGGEAVWVYVLVPTDILEVDFPMLEEPILGSAETLPFTNESDLHNHLTAIGWPESDQWEVSLELGGGVVTNRPIRPDEIIRVEQI